MEKATVKRSHRKQSKDLTGKAQHLGKLNEDLSAAKRYRKRHSSKQLIRENRVLKKMNMELRNTIWRMAKEIREVKMQLLISEQRSHQQNSPNNVLNARLCI